MHWTALLLFLLIVVVNVKKRKKEKKRKEKKTREKQKVMWGLSELGFYPFKISGIGKKGVMKWGIYCGKMSERFALQ